MSPLAKILSYLAAVLLLAAILSPPIYWFCQWLGAQGVFATLAGFPFRRFFSRTAQVSALILLVPLLFWLRIRSMKELGLMKNPKPLRDVVAGLVMALLPLFVLSAVYLYFGVYRMKVDLSFAPMLRILATAALVAVVEEWLFRGVLLGLTARKFGAWPAALAVSIIFAAVHFLKPGKSAVTTVEWWSGFDQFSRILESAPPPVLFLLGFASLFIAGLILALAALRTRSLFLPIGLHAGWIFGQQTFQLLAKYRVKPPEGLVPWIGPNVVSGAVPTGLVPVFVLLLTGLAVWFYLRHAYGSQRLAKNNS